MAKIVLGLGTSHGPMLSTPPEEWGQRAIFDRQIRHHYRGETWSFAELVEARKQRHFEREITLERWRERHAACRQALARLAAVFADAHPDIVVILGNDHMEMFEPAAVPAFSVFWGEALINNPYSAEHMARLAPGQAIALPGHIPPGGARYPCASTLGRHLIEAATAAGFDVASMKQLPREETPHAYGFVYRQIMGDRALPCVPVALNTYYPPNQPSVARCYAFGTVLGRAIESWDSDLTVALIASGGLSHFVIDEELDAAFLDSLRRGDIDKLGGFSEAHFQSGTSEIKNWLPLAGAMAALGFELGDIDYIPCYRSPAGTGNAMGFVSWRP
jgi:3-O-methylgallate 3,4-dioxygenase